MSLVQRCAADEGECMSSTPRTIAPEGLKAPEYVRSWLGDREFTVLNQGFTDAYLGLAWWDGAVAEHRAGPIAWQFDPSILDGRRITRRSLFDMASMALDVATVLPFMVHVLAWGSGSSRRHNHKRLSALTGADADINRELLVSAARDARQGDVRGAYSSLIRSGGGVIPGLGPAFFTKFLYFAGGGEGEVPCLILDARVSRSLHAAGWDGLSTSGGSFSFNWYTDTYVSYCELLAQWARDHGGGARPDEFERALFEGKERP